jgi:hypothetical protein
VKEEPLVAFEVVVIVVTDAVTSAAVGALAEVAVAMKLTASLNAAPDFHGEVDSG